MSIVTQRYTLGVSPGSNSPRIRCSMGDTARDIKLLLYDSDGLFSIPNGVSAVIKGTKSNNVGFLHSCTVGDNYVIFTIVEDMSDIPGIVICEIQLTDSNGGIIGTSNFVIQVENPALSDDSDIGEVDTDIITGIITDIEVYKSSINKIVSDYKDETNQAIEGLRATVGNDVAGIRDTVNNAVSTLNARMDLALQELNEHEVQTVLFDDVNNPLAYIDDTATLEADPTTFDYIDFYYKTHVNDSGQGNWDKVFRFEPNSLFPTIVSVQPSDASATNKTLYVHELSFSLSGTTITVLRSRRWYWSGNTSSAASLQQSNRSSGTAPDNMYGGRVYKIVGVNISDIDELTDLRIGADGTVYQSAGTAIRTQFSAVNNKTASDISYSNTNSGLSATNVQAAIDENAEGLAQTNGRLDEQTEEIGTRIKATYSAFPTETAEGPVAFFSDGTDTPVKALTVDIEPVQSGSGDPSPENIRRMSGRTNGNITLCGKNFLKNTAKSHTTNGVSYVVNADGTITASGKPTGGNGRCDVCNINNPSNALLDAFSGKKLSGCPEGGGAITYSTYRLQLIIDGVLICADFGDGVQIPDLSQYYGASNLYIDATVRPAHTGGAIVYKPMISEDATYDTYVPYSGESYAVTFPSEAGAVYGGTLDVVSGVLTVDKTIRKLGDFTFYSLQVAGENVFQVRTVVFPAGVEGNPSKTWCEALKTMPYGVNASYQTLDNILWPHVNGTFLARCSSYTDVESFKEAMKDINIVVPMNTPQTFQLTPTEVKTLFGINNIYADCGNVSVEYRTDTTAYVEKEITSVYNSIHNIGSDYVIGPDFRKKNVRLNMLGKLKYLQAFCIYNGRYYSTDGAHIAEQDEDFELIRDVSISVGHGNAFQLGSNGKAYISGWDDHKIYVVDLPTLTIDSIINLPTTTGYTTCAVDDVRQFAYIFQTDAGPFTVGTYNFIVYDYANQQVVSTTQVTERFAAMQAVDCYMDLIVGLNGGGTESASNGYRIYTKSGNMVGKFVIGSMSAIEPEGVFIDRSTGDVYMSYNTRAVYKLDILA